MSQEKNYSNDDFENTQSTVDVDTYENDPISALSEVASSEEVITEEVEEKGNHLEDNKNSKKEKRTSFIKELLVYVVIFFIGLYIIPNYVLQRTVVDGDSMLNTLHNEESLLIDKISYVVGDPKRFDIVVFYPYGKDVEEYYVKRVIGLPGETIQIIGQDIYINGEILKENYGKDPIHYAGIAKKPITLADDEYFLMGDNREISYDSRYEEIGPVHRDYIEGKAFLRIWPLKKFGLVN
jgi:signal peptidase I